jgi:hypothetical protein
MSGYEIVPGRPGKSSGRNPDAARPVNDERVVTEVGEFRQGNDASDWVLRRYLLTRALGTSIVRTVQWMGVSIFLLAALVWVAGVTWLAVLIALVAIFVLLIRSLLGGIQRRMSGTDQLGPAAARIDGLVRQTRKGVHSELKRIGLPSAPWGPVLIGMRLIRPFKRVETVRRLSRFDLTKVVSPATLDELQLLLRSR